VAVRILQHTGNEVGKMLNIKRAAVSHAVRRGEEIVAGNGALADKILH